MAGAAAELSPPARRFESERIHASPTVLLIAAIGLAIHGVGRLVGFSQAGATVTCIGTLMLVLAIVLHVDHLSFRIGRSAVVLVILGTLLHGVGSLLSALGVSNRSPVWFYGAGWVIGAVGVAMVAIHKERQMQSTLADYAAGAPWQARVTVHASFLSLITAATGLVLYGTGALVAAGAGGRSSYILMCAGAVLIAIGVISHVEHLVSRIGLPAVIAAILAPMFFCLAAAPNAFNPEGAASQARFLSLCLGIGALLASLACALAFGKKLRTDR